MGIDKQKLKKIFIWTQRQFN